jgi:hypothetical protein
MGLAMRSVERIMVKCLIYDTRSVGLGKAAFGRHGRVLDSQNKFDGSDSKCVVSDYLLLAKINTFYAR